MSRDYKLNINKLQQSKHHFFLWQQNLQQLYWVRTGKPRSSLLFCVTTEFAAATLDAHRVNRAHHFFLCDNKTHNCYFRCTQGEPRSCILDCKTYRRGKTHLKLEKSVCQVPPSIVGEIQTWDLPPRETFTPPLDLHKGTSEHHFDYI